jgi:hypothetical protein
METENGRRRRPRSDTAVRRLTSEQRAKVAGWLFDEHLPYREVAVRCQNELGVALTEDNVGAYCRQERSLGRSWAAGASTQDGGPGYIAMVEAMNRAAQRAAHRIEITDDPRMLAEFARVLVAARREASEALRASTLREKFEFDAATACLVHQVKMQSIVADEALTDQQRILKIREELFGPDLPL